MITREEVEVLLKLDRIEATIYNDCFFIDGARHGSDGNVWVVKDIRRGEMFVVVRPCVIHLKPYINEWGWQVYA